MAQQLQNITIQAAGFAGLNTQDSPIGLDASFAATANNCVIDQLGRIGARKGYTNVSSNGGAVLGSSRGIEMVYEYCDSTGDKRVLSAGNNKIFSGTSTLTDITPVGYTPTANNWKVVTLNNHAYLFQRGHENLVYTDETGSPVLTKHSAHPSATGTPPQANEVLAAYGRLWAADVANNKHTVYWSDTLNGHAWTGGTSGSLDVTTVFPTGFDEITALAAHNGFLIIFCKKSILVYSGASSPASMTLVDTVEGVGCIARDSVQHTGTDILFLSENGVRSFGRTIQEKSMPMRDISKNVRNDLMELVSVQTNPIKALYSPEEAFYIITLPDSNTTYCFDMRTSLPDGSQRATTWSDITPLSLTRLDNGTIYFGKSDGIKNYTGYQDGTASYIMSYFSNPMDFGNPSNLKFLKKFNLTVIGSVSATTVLNWGYDYSTSYQKQTFSSGLTNTTEAEYNVSEYNTTAEYSTGTEIQLPEVSGTGSGSVVTVGVESTISGSPYSIQKLDIHALLGRLL
jgi:hypothetical protein|tara:strand:+ start:3520 stop:5058 length:1539 start_codon:yes stop_codon:yes gene_type:complete